MPSCPLKHNSFSATPTTTLSFDSWMSPGHHSYWGSLDAEVPGINKSPNVSFSVVAFRALWSLCKQGSWRSATSCQSPHIGCRGQAASGTLALMTDASFVLLYWAGMGGGWSLGIVGGSFRKNKIGSSFKCLCTMLRILVSTPKVMEKNGHLNRLEVLRAGF